MRIIGVLGNKHIPNFVYSYSKQKRLELLAGLIDADGYLTKDKKGYIFNNTNEVLISGVLRLARSLGFVCTVHERVSKCQT